MNSVAIPEHLMSVTVDFETPVKEKHLESGVWRDSINYAISWVVEKDFIDRVHQDKDIGSVQFISVNNEWHLSGSDDDLTLVKLKYF